MAQDQTETEIRPSLLEITHSKEPLAICKYWVVKPPEGYRLNAVIDPESNMMVVVLEPIQDVEEEDEEESIVSIPEGNMKRESLRHSVSDFMLGLGGIR